MSPTGMVQFKQYWIPDQNSLAWQLLINELKAQKSYYRQGICVAPTRTEELGSGSGEFTLHKGCIHFVLGRSGIGKSTLIEALGLMEQTVRGDSNCSVKLYRGDDVFDILDAWSNGPRGLSEFRQKHFSFIFQSTNLLPNLSLAENVLMPAWIAGINDDDDLHSELSGMLKDF